MLTRSGLSLHILAQIQQVTDPVVDKGLDSAVSFAQSVSQWAYITIGASVALLFKDVTQRPKSPLVRWSFLAFIPGWGCLGYAIWKGVRVHGAYIAYLMSKQHDAQVAIQNINADAASQLTALRCGLFVFGGWLLIYLIWWVAHRDGSK